MYQLVDRLMVIIPKMQGLIHFLKYIYSHLCMQVAPSSLTLNSSGEENQSPPEHLQSMPSVSASEKQSRLPRPKQLDTITDLDMITDENGLALREQHNQKERRRRYYN